MGWLAFCFATYLLAGLACLALVSRHARRLSVRSAHYEAFDTFNFFPLSLVLGLWPLFALNDVLLAFPRQRYQRLATHRKQRPLAHASRTERKRKHRDFNLVVGQRGIAVTKLGLGGCVEVDKQEWQAVSEHGWIDAGTPIVVTARRGNELRVKPAAGSDSPAAG